MSIEQIIPLNQLVHSKANVRQTGRTEGIGELAASIAAHGLRQNLNVLPSETTNRFEVVAGGRRLRAMKQLVRAGKLAKDAPIACLVLGEGDDPAEISLAENAMRTAMHPDDQFEAFRALIEDKGASVEDVAARFGVTPAVVKQRLKLANVSPKLRALFRKGEMGLDHVMALAISDDHAAQEQAWENLPDWNQDASLLKDALTSGSLPMSDRLVKFVGVETYVEAGGTITRDLFDEDCEGFLSDRNLVMQLISARLEQEVETVRAEGWKWVKTEIVRDHKLSYGRIWPSDEGEEEGQTTYAAEDISRAGAIVRVGYDGQLDIERGCIHPDDAKAEARREGSTKAKAANPSGYSAALVEDLTAHRTAALRIALAQNPAVALAMTVHALTVTLFHPGAEASCLDLRACSEPLVRHVRVQGDSPAHQAMAEEGERWGDRLPGDGEGLLDWCLDQSQEVLLELLAFLAALSVDGIETKQGREGRHDHADRLGGALGLDMTQWWTPSVEGFYERLSKAGLVRAVTEAKVSAGVALDSVKKAEGAKFVAKALAGSGWLPEPLRTTR